jgi:2-polyprenyl-3-methyl-5-hydroxy-6-metoxy-1,4-benzoquinol methylase
MRKEATKRLRETTHRFTERYQEQRGDAGAAIQREVIGAELTVNGYTTVAQANRLGRELRLRAGVRLLDLGAGNGWPGVHLAKATGCEVVMADLPRPSLKRALGRARRLRLIRRAGAVQATATMLPFQPATFDAIVHTDVMC